MHTVSCEQFQNVMKLGPLSRVMSMIPGLPQGLAQKGGEKEGADRIRRFMFMMDSMNDSELDGKNIHQDGEAIMRIARGSGTAPEEVHALLQYHKQMEKMVGKMGKTSLMNQYATAPLLLCCYFYYYQARVLLLLPLLRY